MLIIKETADKGAAQNFLDSLGISYSIAEDIVMICEENGMVLGVSTLRLCGAKVYIDLLVTVEEDMSLKLGLAKSLMNLADLRGIKLLYGKNEALKNIYTALRFKENEGEYCVSLEGYFTAGHSE